MALHSLVNQVIRQSDNHLPSLTGIRALAAWMVFVHHFAVIPEHGTFTFWQHFLYEFHIGVSLFFVLSGFLITLRYYEGFSEHKIRLKDYFLNRFARVYPMYFIITTATFVACACGMLCKEPPGISTGENYVMHITFLRGFFGNLWFTGLVQGWTLTVEECFYILAPLIFFFARKGKFTLWIQPLALLAFGFLLVLVFRNADFHGFFGGNRFMLLRTFFGRCFEFFVGIQLAFIWMKYKQRSSEKPVGFSFPLFTFGGLAAIVGCLATLALIKGDYEQGLYHPAGIVINNFMLPVCVAVLFWGLLTEQSPFRTLLSTGLFQLFGKSSYTFYLIHMGILSVWMQMYMTDNPWLIFAGMVGISILLYWVIEEPLNRWIRSLGKQRM